MLRSQGPGAAGASEEGLGTSPQAYSESPRAPGFVDEDTGAQHVFQEKVMLGGALSWAHRVP